MNILLDNGPRSENRTVSQDLNVFSQTTFFSSVRFRKRISRKSRLVNHCFRMIKTVRVHTLVGVLCYTGTVYRVRRATITKILLHNNGPINFRYVSQNHLYYLNPFRPNRSEFYERPGIGQLNASASPSEKKFSLTYTVFGQPLLVKSLFTSANFDNNSPTL